MKLSSWPTGACIRRLRRPAHEVHLEVSKHVMFKVACCSLPGLLDHVLMSTGNVASNITKRRQRIHESKSLAAKTAACCELRQH